jgi:hypothetical protein
MSRRLVRFRDFAFVARCVGLAAGVVACNSLDTTTADNSQSSCAITVAGPTAIAGEYTCTVSPITLYVATTNTTVVNIGVGGSKTISGLFALIGPPIAGQTYTSSSSAGLQSYGLLVKNGDATWEFAAGGQTAPLGSGSMTFTSVGGGVIGGTSTLYVAHGTIDANLVASPGTPATGNATVHVTF